ncbi:hypothetical protein PG989_000490 [Apiospora arundinis]
MAMFADGDSEFVDGRKSRLLAGINLRCIQVDHSKQLIVVIRAEQEIDAYSQEVLVYRTLEADI